MAINKELENRERDYLDCPDQEAAQRPASGQQSPDRRPALGDGGGPGCSAFKIHANDSNDRCPRKQNLDISHQTFSDHGPPARESSWRRLLNQPEPKMGIKIISRKALRRQRTHPEPGRAASPTIPTAWNPGNRPYREKRV